MEVRITVASGIRAALLAVALLVAMADMARAQDRPGPAAEFAAGWAGFTGNGFANESLVGGAARFYLTPQFSVGPEVVYIQGDGHGHLNVTGNVTWDTYAPTNGRPRRVSPFLVAAVGVSHANVSGGFHNGILAFSAGGGARVAVGDRVTIGFDMRMGGWEFHFRANGLVGVRLGR